MRLPIDKMVGDACLVERHLKDVGSPCTSPVADLCCHVKAMACEIETLRIRLLMLAKVSATCCSVNTDEWMEYLADSVNLAIEELGDRDRIEFRGTGFSKIHTPKDG